VARSGDDKGCFWYDLKVQPLSQLSRQMDTIEEYKIIESQDLGSLAEKVNAALKEGWQPHGAPFIHVRAAAMACCQAMVNFHQPTSAETIAKLRRAAANVFRR
jgi:hypothetical protein